MSLILVSVVILTTGQGRLSVIMQCELKIFKMLRHFFFLIHPVFLQVNHIHESYSLVLQDYSTDGMSNNLMKFVQHLREFGLLYQRKRTSGRFYPTSLALNIASGESKNSIESNREGYIVVETNYRLYAYTDSNLQIALLGLFTEILYR